MKLTPTGISMNVALCGLALWLYCGPLTMPREPSMGEVKAEVARNWLETQRKGQKGLEYWHETGSPVSFFALESYEIVDAPDLGPCVVRVHSSTKGGQPIVKLWRVWVGEGKITLVEPNESPAP